MGDGGIDVLLDSETCHGRSANCAYARDDALVGSPASARGCEMVTQNVSLCGRRGWSQRRS